MTERDPYLRAVGLRIKALRVRREVSQDQLADTAGVSRVTLGSIERGEHAAQVLTYVKIAHALACDVGDLLTERETLWPQARA